MRMKKYEISVVMTVYGKEVFLDEAIESILCQTYKDFEFIIVIEHGADAETIASVQSYAGKDKRVRLIYNKKRLGLAESLNVGIRLAKGKYIARMDDDDVSLPWRFQKQRELLEQEQEIGVCGGLQVTLKPDGEHILHCAVDSEHLKAELLFGCQLSHTSVMFRKNLFVDHGWFYDGNKLAEDFDLWIRILDKTKMTNIDEVLVKHRYGYNNISVQKGQKLYKENVETIKWALERYLGIHTMKWRDELFCPWRSFPKDLDEKQLWEMLTENVDFMLCLEQANKEKHFIKAEIFAKVLMQRFRWILNNIARKLGIRELAYMLDHMKISDGKLFAENLAEMLCRIYPIYSPYDQCREMWRAFLHLKHTDRVIVYGLGQAHKYFVDRYEEDLPKYGIEIVALTDSNDQNMRSENKRILPWQISDMEYDMILISSGRYYFDIREKLIEEYGIPEYKIALLDQLICVIKGAV